MIRPPQPGPPDDSPAHRIVDAIDRVAERLLILILAVIALGVLVWW